MDFSHNMTAPSSGKYLFLSYLIMFVSIFSSAQDIIVFRNGDIERGKVKEITEKEIKYKKKSNPDGPIYSIDKFKVLSINYENGEKDIFEREDQALSETHINNSNNTSDPVFIPPTPAEDNEEMIAYINSQEIYHKNKTPNEKKYKDTNYVFKVYGIKPNSILSDKNISVSFALNPTYEVTWDKPMDVDHDNFCPNYKIIINNKTDKIIYVDVANCFRIFEDGKSETFLNSLSVSNSSSTSIGANLNIGAVSSALGIGGIVGTLTSGIGIGGSRNNQTIITETESTILSIPPHGNRELPAKITSNEKKTKTAKNYEILYDSLWDIVDNTKVEQWAYTENNDPQLFDSIKYLITYSDSPNFATYTSIMFEVYCKGLFGVNMFTKFSHIMPTNGFKFTSRRIWLSSDRD